MNKGYRYSAQVAYYRYQQDKQANFGIPGAGMAANAWNTAKGWGQGAVQGVKNVGMRIDSLAQAGGARAGQFLQNQGNALVTNQLPRNGMLMGAGSNLANAGRSIAEGGRYGKLARRAIGYGVPAAGAAALGGAGYLGYRALNNGQGQEQY